MPASALAGLQWYALNALCCSVLHPSCNGGVAHVFFFFIYNRSSRLRARSQTDTGCWGSICYVSPSCQGRVCV
uniref:Putative secreted peptide n=1 Tax=Anopheles braziliensis TaxID=58242 RepID=A0A2M3ZXQ2_9DIPT